MKYEQVNESYRSERFLRYPGSKGKGEVISQILPYFPREFGEYREPFCGSMAVALATRADGSPWTTKPIWVNDLNRNLIAVYEALKCRPKAFIEACMAIVPARQCPETSAWLEPTHVTRKGTAYPKRLWDKFHELLDDHGADAALRYIFLNRCSMNGRVILDPARRNRNTFTNPWGWAHQLFDQLAKVAERLSAMTVTCSDYAMLFEEPGHDVFIFADAPYYCDTVAPQSSKLYEFGFSEKQHVELRDTVNRTTHKIALTYDDHPRIRQLYNSSRFLIHELNWKYASTKTHRVGNEVLITNYTPQFA